MEQLIYSPNYPSNYNDKDYCSWYLEAPCGKFILLELLDFQIEQRYDAITVFDTEVSTTDVAFPDKYTYDGSTIKGGERKVIKHWISDLHWLALDFNTDCTVNAKGFRMRYSLLGICTINYLM